MSLEVETECNSPHLHTGPLRADPPYPEQGAWTLQSVLSLFEAPFFDLLFRAHDVHRKHFDPQKVQISTLLSIKTGGCPEKCNYCPQSAHFNTDVQKENLLPLEQVVAAAKRAKETGASRFCMGAAWRGPNQRNLEAVIEMIREVRSLGLETCATLGLLDDGQAEQLKEAGLDYYNHNIDTSESYYEEIISTRTFQDRLDTLQRVRTSGLKVCCGGIIGMGETVQDRAEMLYTLASLPVPPESVPINRLIPIPGTPLADSQEVSSFDFIRTIAVTRILMPASWVRLSAGRESMSDEVQALCFFAGANSIFYGEKLLTAANPVPERDLKLFAELDIEPAR